MLFLKLVLYTLTRRCWVARGKSSFWMFKSRLILFLNFLNDPYWFSRWVNSNVRTFRIWYPLIEDSGKLLFWQSLKRKFLSYFGVHLVAEKKDGETQNIRREAMYLLRNTLSDPEMLDRIAKLRPCSFVMPYAADMMRGTLEISIIIVCHEPGETPKARWVISNKFGLFSLP